jgi:Amt family ammonium transporter
MIAVGAVAERGRLGPALAFVFIWTTIVYDPIACWTWNRNGWSHAHGVLDFAGGTPVHISSGTAAFAISAYLGKRTNYVRLAYKPHNTTYVVLGTVLMWFGWFGFNGGAFRIMLCATQSVMSFKIQDLPCPQIYGLRRLSSSLTWLPVSEEPPGCFW